MTTWNYILTSADMEASALCQTIEGSNMTFLAELEERVCREAYAHGCDHFAIFAADESVVHKGEVRTVSERARPEIDASKATIRGIVDCTGNPELFRRLANRHIPCQMFMDVRGSTVSFRVTAQGELRKTFAEFSLSEPAEVKSLFRNKHMSLNFPLGGFQPRWIESWLSAIAEFRGPLRDLVYDVRLAQHRLDQEQKRSKKSTEP